MNIDIGDIYWTDFDNIECKIKGKRPAIIISHINDNIIKVVPISTTKFPTNNPYRIKVFNVLSDGRTVNIECSCVSILSKINLIEKLGIANNELVNKILIKTYTIDELSSKLTEVATTNRTNKINDKAKEIYFYDESKVSLLLENEARLPF